MRSPIEPLNGGVVFLYLGVSPCFIEPLQNHFSFVIQIQTQIPILTSLEIAKFSL